MTSQRTAGNRIIVLGASAGGISAILALASKLEADFPVPILLVQHIGAHRSELDKLISARGPNRAVMGRDGQTPEPGVIHVAPSDHHMFVEDGKIRLSRGPKENYARPAVDPLFRSVALEFGQRAIGVILTGRLDDGTVGLRAIKDCGGLAVVQDPKDAHAPEMPGNALKYVAADHVVTLDMMAPLLGRLAMSKVAHKPLAACGDLREEHLASQGNDATARLPAIAAPSAFSCPDCGGVLFEMRSKSPVRYRCHTGHAYTLDNLAHGQQEATDTALWTSIRALQEKQMLLRRKAQVSPGPEALQALQEADELSGVVSMLARLIKAG